jgi:WD40 repeat protein
MRLILWLWQWQIARMLSALGLSLSAVSFFVVTVSLVLLPADLKELQAPLYLSITHCHVMPGGQRAISLVWYMPRDTSQGWRHQLAAHDLAGAQPALELSWPQLESYSAHSLGGRESLYVAGWDGSLWKVNAARPGSQPQLLGRHPEQGPHDIAASADGRWLVTLGPDTLQVLDAASGRPVWTRGDVRSCALHPCGERIAASLEDGRLVELDRATGRLQRVVARYENPSLTVEFSPDGRRLAMTGGESSLTLLDWESGNSALPERWRDVAHRCRSSTLVFSPDGERLVTSGRQTSTLAVWNLRTMELEAELIGHEKSINGAAFLDQHRLCSFGADGTIRIWDLVRRGRPEVITLDVTPQAG